MTTRLALVPGLTSPVLEQLAVLEIMKHDARLAERVGEMRARPSSRAKGKAE